MRAIYGDSVATSGQFAISDINRLVGSIDFDKSEVDGSIPQRFARQLDLRGEAFAIRERHQILSYRRLDALSNQIANIELSTVSEDAATESLALTEASYSNGAVSIVQLIDAQNNHLQAQLARANANYNYLLSSIIMERYIGYFFLLRSDEENQIFLQRFIEFQITNRQQ